MGGSDEWIDYDYTEMNKCFNEKHSTDFASGSNMDEMQAMLRNANPGAVKGVAEGWSGLSAALLTIQSDFDAEVARIQEHWTGSAADNFATKAKQASKSLGDCATYATHTSTAMANAGSVLEHIQPEVMAMEKPGAFSSFMNSAGDGFTRSDKNLNQDLASGAGAQQALDDNHDDLSAGREAQLKMAAKMETLGAAYNSQSKAMGSWRKTPGIEEEQDYPGEPGGITPTPVPVPTARSPRSPGSVSEGTGRSAQKSSISSSKAVASPSGVTGGAYKPSVPTQTVGTAIDGIAGGRTEVTGTGGGTQVPGGTSPNGSVGASGPAGSAAGSGSGTARGGVGGRSGAARAGGAAAAASARGGMAGRAGAGGVGGAAGTGAAKGAARGAGAARQSGGVVGGTPRAGAGAGRGTAGGSGLHSSRGATGRGAGAVHKGGLVGAPGARSGRQREQEERESERPDYLIEDEETWAPQRNVAPRVIEE